MIFPMGCGGSRADAIIEPRYHESWTRETESTWLTNTDIETPLPVASSKALEAGLREKRTVNTGTQCGKQALTTAGSNHQRRARRSLSDVGVPGMSVAQLLLFPFPALFHYCIHLSIKRSFCQAASKNLNQLH
ncbi:brain and acute leukemia cytoplasmic protein isoform X1 [Scophthalmus maximus]|uniref:brain and acute leukemia cytoplasmic protein isoform X1 n=1 Tax=Scophthalmus maximus TaxID=52904 RepID=UPI0015E0FBED|nr:brain and acute leukemia cytoplasmic protein isoform X1 [Scophthalmus maximus]